MGYYRIIKGTLYMEKRKTFNIKDWLMLEREPLTRDEERIKMLEAHDIPLNLYDKIVRRLGVICLYCEHVSTSRCGACSNPPKDAEFSVSLQQERYRVNKRIKTRYYKSYAVKHCRHFKYDKFY